MTRPLRVCFPFLLLCFVICTYSATAQPPAPTVKTFVSKEGRFSVQLPSRPKYSIQKKGENGLATDNHVYLLESADSEYYVSYSDFKPEVIKGVNISKLLDGARDGGVANSKGKLLSEKSVTLDGNPGREIAIELPGDQKTKVPARFYMVESRLYSILYAGPYASADSAEADSFLVSLKLQKPMALPVAWLSVDSPEGRFRVKMPGTPVASIDKPGTKDAVHLWQFISDKDKLIYFVAYSDLPDVPKTSDTIEAVLDKGRDSLAQSLKATVADDSLLSVDGNPGREAHMWIGPKDTPDVIILFHGFIVNGRYYQVMALGSKAAMEKGKVDDFMDSFQLITMAPATKQ